MKRKSYVVVNDNLNIVRYHGDGLGPCIPLNQVTYTLVTKKPKKVSLIKQLEQYEVEKRRLKRKWKDKK